MHTECVHVRHHACKSFFPVEGHACMPPHTNSTSPSSPPPLYTLTCSIYLKFNKPCKVILPKYIPAIRSYCISNEPDKILWPLFITCTCTFTVRFQGLIVSQLPAYPDKISETNLTMKGADFCNDSSS